MAGEDIIMASQKELKRLHVVQKVLEGMVRQTASAVAAEEGAGRGDDPDGWLPPRLV
jgi:hypothetical protein